MEYMVQHAIPTGAQNRKAGVNPFEYIGALLRGVWQMAQRKIENKAFRRGFGEGFAAPMFFLVPQLYPRAQQIDPSMAGAWRRVGKALNKSYQGEGKRIGKAAGKEREHITVE